MDPREFNLILIDACLEMGAKYTEEPGATLYEADLATMAAFRAEKEFLGTKSVYSYYLRMWAAARNIIDDFGESEHGYFCKTSNWENL